MPCMADWLCCNASSMASRACATTGRSLRSRPCTETYQAIRGAGPDELVMMDLPRLPEDTRRHTIFGCQLRNSHQAGDAIGCYHRRPMQFGLEACCLSTAIGRRQLLYLSLLDGSHTFPLCQHTLGGIESPAALRRTEIQVGDRERRRQEVEPVG